MWRITEEQSIGVDAGTASINQNFRGINTYSANGGSAPGNVIRTGDVITILPGRYFIRGSAPGSSNGPTVREHVVSFAISGGAIVIRGTAESVAGLGSQNRSIFSGWLDVGDSTDYKIEHWFSATIPGTGLGRATGLNGGPEVYAEVTILQVG